MLGGSLLAGTLFAFSALVTTALDRLPAGQAVAARQSINRVILRSAFMSLFFVSALVGDGLTIAGVLRWGESAAWQPYRRHWTRSNHLRTAAALVASVLSIVGLRAG